MRSRVWEQVLILSVSFFDVALFPWFVKGSQEDNHHFDGVPPKKETTHLFVPCWPSRTFTSQSSHSNSKSSASAWPAKSSKIPAEATRHEPKITLSGDKTLGILVTSEMAAEGYEL